MVQKESYNGQSDVWAIGVLTYELLVGRIPFSIWSELDLQLIVNQEVIFPDYVDISQDGKDFITKCLSKKQEERIRLHELRMHSFLDSYQASSFSTEVYDALEATF